MTVRPFPAAPALFGRFSCFALASIGLAACSSSGGTMTSNPDTGVQQTMDAAPVDTGPSTPDTGALPLPDSGALPDSGRADTGVRLDAGTPDSGSDLPVIIAFFAQPTFATRGNTVTLSWTVRNADRVSMSADPGGDVPIPPAMATCNPTTTCMGQIPSPPINSDVAFTLTAYKGAQSVFRPIGVALDPGQPMIGRFIADPMSVPRGGTSTLRWTTSNATHVKITQGATTLFMSNSTDANPMVASGSLVTPPLNDPTGLNPFTLEATNDFPNRMISQHVIISTN